METVGLNREARRLPLKSVAPEALRLLAAPRPPLMGVTMDRPRILGVLNVTPDSFSDGRPGESVAAAVERGLEMAASGADFIDVGGESTRPGSDPLEPAAEQDRVLPVIEGLKKAGLSAPISIDTRNAATARAAFEAGAAMLNDVSALTHDEESLGTVVEFGGAVCLMHAQGDPKTMQDAPRYRNVLIEVYDWLESRVAVCVKAGVPRGRIVVDPGIGFGKTLAHNLTLIGGLAAFHGLGCAVMLGASRKAFIGRLTGVENAADRVAGSIGAALAGAGRGAHVFRVHDVAQTRQALDVWRAAAWFDGDDE
ncbi:dihydropteroate synthase [Pikeienuella piscinae]|uniref:dihydropteroate synthase n=2 Tax=Pikeienuella piscinae TaxID=2748098 RepID=A0A7M3T710_9RHOB|nr:dihydropteroate synthase [Pikeienuella piscinae]